MERKKLSQKQMKFSQDVVSLLLFAMEKGFRFTFGEVMRPKEMQEIYYRDGRSTTMNSMHVHKLAIDINFFKPDGKTHTLTYLKADLQEIGEFWESLDDKNEWGGNWEYFLDTPHFQRTKH